jgi:hypothetical protein
VAKSRIIFAATSFHRDSALNFDRFKFFIQRPEILFILLLILLYAPMAAFTVQSGDTGELVTNSYFLRISHPPGYPLWSLLYHIPVRWMGSTPFQGASIFTIALTLIWLGTLMKLFRGPAALIVLGVMATSLVVWRYAILPDVFALHAMFLALIFICFMRPGLLKKPWMIFIISLSVAHHHTIIFVLPLYLYALYLVPGKRKALAYSLIFGALSLSLYLLLLWFHPEDYGSWSRLSSLADVVNHFLRREYGTFRLQARVEHSHSWLLFYMEHLLLNSWSLILIIGFILARHLDVIKAHRKPLWVLVFSLTLYLLFFSLAGGINLGREGELIAERFLIHPTLLLFFMVLFVLERGSVRLPVPLLALACLNLGTNVFKNYEAVDYSKNTYLEDYLLNQLQLIPPGQIYYTYGDSIGFGTYYLKDVLAIRPDIIHIHPSWGFPWGPRKFKSRHPEVIRQDGDNLFESIKFDQYRFFTNYGPRVVPEGLAVAHHGPLFEIGPADEIAMHGRYRCDQQYSWRFRPGPEQFGAFDVGKFYDLAYGNCHYVKGLELLAKRNFAAAAETFSQGLALSPHSVKLRERLCSTYKELGDPRFNTCDERLEQLLSVMSQHYYTEK